MGFFHEYYGRMFGQPPNGQPEVRLNEEWKYRPRSREDLELVHEGGVSMTDMMGMMPSPAGLRWSCW